MYMIIFLHASFTHVFAMNVSVEWEGNLMEKDGNLEFILDLIKKGKIEERSILQIIDNQFYSGIKSQLREILWLAPRCDPDEPGRPVDIYLPSYRGLFFVREPHREENFSLTVIWIGYEETTPIKVEAYLQDGVFADEHSVFPVPIDVIPEHLRGTSQCDIHVKRGDVNGMVRFSDIDL